MRCPRAERSTTARRLVQCSDRAANVWRPHCKRTANAQQARSKRAASAQQARSDQRCMKHVCCIEIHTDMHYYAVTYIQICTALTAPQECICECMCMYVGCIFQTYRHICTGYSSYDPMIHTDTASYIQIHTCAYDICTVHMSYELCYILCISARICVCMFGTYIQHISVHMCAICA